MPEAPRFRLCLHRGKWSAEWYEEGCRYRRSSGTDDRRVAERWIREFEAEFTRERRPSSPALSYVWEEYRRYLAKDKKPAAVTMTFEWKAIGPYFGDMQAEGITEDDCRAYAERRR